MFEGIVVGIILGIGLTRSWMLIREAMKRDVARSQGNVVGIAARDIKRGELVESGAILTSGTVVLRKDET